MASTESTPAAPPAASSVQFARAILLRFSIWPTLKTAVAEQWGGPESESKRDFLVGHLVDEYGMPDSPSNAGPSPSSASGSNTTTNTPQEIDVDDLADVLQDYVEEEYECRIEDDSVFPVARDIVALHQAIFITSLTDGGAEERKIMEELEGAATRLKGVKQQNQRQSDVPEDEDEEDGSGEEEENDAGANGNEHGAAQDHAMEDVEMQEPEVDEDGFQTVRHGRRRR
ncbi:hypothetical protein CF326_g2938 [Tilletia indica]|nr:hypothetical protein CF326_g2938 [Tilletia indica]